MEKNRAEERRRYRLSCRRGFLFLSFSLGFFGIRRASHPPKNLQAKKEKNYYNKNNSKPEFPDPVCPPIRQPSQATTKNQPTYQTTNCDSFSHVKFARRRCFPLRFMLDFLYVRHWVCLGRCLGERCDFSTKNWAPRITLLPAFRFRFCRHFIS